MANVGGTDTNDTQFFVTQSNSNPIATPTSLDYGYTIFGQTVSGQSILNDMTEVAVEANEI